MNKNYRLVTNPEMLPMVLTPSDIGNVLGLSRNRTYELVHSKDFPAFRVPQSRRFKTSARLNPASVKWLLLLDWWRY